MISVWQLGMAWIWHTGIRALSRRSRACRSAGVPDTSLERDSGFARLRVW